MKRTVRTVLLLAVAFSAAANIFAQTGSVKNEGNDDDGYLNAFEADSAVWSFYFAHHCYEPSILYQTILYGDTVMDNVKWKIVRGEEFNSYGRRGFIRSEGKKIVARFNPEYFENWENTPEDIVIYDFSSNVGDSVLLFYEPYDKRYIKNVITEIDSIVLNDGKKHKRMKYGSYGVYDRYLIEGVGFIGTTTPFIVFFARTTCSSGPYVTCCQVNGKTLFVEPNCSNNCCESNPDANETVDGDAQNIKIHFYDSQLTIRSENDELFDVEVYNTQGMRLLIRKGNRNEVTLGLNDIAKGIYFVRVTGAGHSYLEKFIKP
jgi:hypothetical protein